MNAIDWVRQAASKDITREWMFGAWSVDGKRTVATDGHRLHLAEGVAFSHAVFERDPEAKGASPVRHHQHDHYSHLLPVGGGVELDGAALKRAVREAAGLFVKENRSDVVVIALEPRENEIAVREVSYAREDKLRRTWSLGDIFTVPAPGMSSGKPVGIAAKYLLEALGSRVGRIRVLLEGPRDAIKIVHLDGRTAVVMPRTL